ncbi:hypothetical protein [Pontibacter sp. G13]|uniref:hypothetical protein n=1 Tax=Pontibacter sp. G13 TaxID=3074898 RepID=UPI00288C265E|nr:hypothetical protein [Pontibacter sp. G13]WNJ19173.1 hypothetical protein RJD25_01665 [Pontibacter sp. G13]
MRPILFYILFLIPCLARSQWSDDFSDGNLHQNPPWRGDTAFFHVNPSLQLQSQGRPETESLLIYTPLDMRTNMHWSGQIQTDFSASASNQIRIHLWMDHPDPDSALFDLWLELGESGSEDAPKLNVRSENQISSLLQGAISSAADPLDLGYQVIWDSTGLLRMGLLHADSSEWAWHAQSGYAFPTGLGVFAIEFRHTASRANGLTIDDLAAGSPIQDTLPPAIREIIPLDSHQLELVFDEWIMAPQTLSINRSSDGQAAEWIHPLPDHLVATWPTGFTVGAMDTLTLEGILDSSENDASIAFPFQWEWAIRAQPGMVNLREILPDPIPSRGLPAFEFIEIGNETHHWIDLTGISVTIGSRTADLAPTLLAPHHVMVLCPLEAVSEFDGREQVMGLAEWPSLTNSGATISLKDAHGELLDRLSYDSEWFDGEEMDGRSLERVYASLPGCQGSDHWMVSEEFQGGSPGELGAYLGTNMRGQDPQIEALLIPSPQQIDIQWTQPVLASDQSANWAIFPNEPAPQSVSWSSDLKNYSLRLESPLESHHWYTLELDSLQTCEGAFLALSTSLAIPKTPVQGEVWINELLFDPVSGGADFVELQTTAEWPLDGGALYVAGIDSNDLPVRLLPDGYLLMPHAYPCFSEDAAHIRRQYLPPGNSSIIEVPNLPPFPDDAGICQLLNSSGIVLDSMSYEADQHLAVIHDSEGVALERISVSIPSSHTDNWHSAASTHHFGTPGYENSQQFRQPVIRQKLTVAPKIFTPDGDGVDDWVSISLADASHGHWARVRIFDLGGRVIRRISEGDLLGPDGITYLWNGRDDRGRLVTMGPYVVLWEAMNVHTGGRRQYRGMCILGKDMR